LEEFDVFDVLEDAPESLTVAVILPQVLVSNAEQTVMVAVVPALAFVEKVIVDPLMFILIAAGLVLFEAK